MVIYCTLKLIVVLIVFVSESRTDIELMCSYMRNIKVHLVLEFFYVESILILLFIMDHMKFPGLDMNHL